MVWNSVRILALAIFVASLSACGAASTTGTTDSGGEDNGGNGGGDGGGSGGDGGDGGGPPPSALFVATPEERTAYLDTIRPAVAAMGPASVQGGVTTNFAALPPPLGTMTYAGYLEILTGTATIGANVAGSATLTLTLSDLSMTGSATDFVGITKDENLVDQVVNYSGTIAITNGSVTEGPAGNSVVTLDIDGELDSGLNVFDIDGTLVGGLYGAGGEGLRARGTNTGLDGSMVTTVDGAPSLYGVGTISALLQ